MGQPARRSYSLENYYSVEYGSDIKHEYYDGEIFAMAGASTPHNRISGSLIVALGTALRGSSCEPFTSDQRVTTPSGLYTYPDASVFCDEVETAGYPPHSATNPVALFEILSKSTRDYDRGAKFDLYASIPSLRYYVLIEQTEMRVEVRTRDEGEWTTTVLTEPDDFLTLPAINFRAPLREIYERVQFDG